MDYLNRELEASINDLRAQPGVNPTDVERLQASIMSDGALLVSLNAHASAGRLKGFHAADAGGEGAAVGSFDPASGLVTLPKTSLRSGGAELAATLRIQNAMIDFSNSPYPGRSGQTAVPTPEMIHNLETVTNQSPYLAHNIKRQMSEKDPADPDQRYLKGFSIHADNEGSGGQFNRSSHVMSFPADALISKSSVAPNGYFKPDNLTFVIGHELQHAYNHPGVKRGTDQLVNTAMAVARDKNRVHDYTEVVGNYVASTRTDEAKAEIGGWNALLGRKQQIDPTAGWQDMLGATGQVEDFVFENEAGVTVSREGLTFEIDGSLAQSPENIEAMGKHYFDKPSQKYAQPGERHIQLGHDNAGDYRAHYSRTAINIVSQVEDGARVIKGVHSVPQINMKKLGLHEDLIEEQGLNLGTGKTALPYLDSSDAPASRHYFNHTTQDSDHPFQYVPDPAQGEPHSALHRELGRLLPEGTSSDRLAQVALAAKEGGIEAGSIRSLDVIGERLMLTGVTPGTNAMIDLSSAPPPMMQSNAQFAVVEQQQVHMQLQISHQQSGPSMSMGR